MTSFKLFGAALILSTAFATPVFAQSAAGLPEVPYDLFLLDDWAFDDWAFLSPHDFRKGPEEPRAAMTVQPGRVVVAQVIRPTRPHRTHHISSTRAN
jgi:hypothetical protein